MSVTPHKGYLLQRDKGRAIWFLNGLLTWKAGDAETGGRWELVEQLCPRGFAPPVHSHDVEAEGFYVLDGEVTFVLDDERVVAAPGSFVYVPAGCRHSFVVESAVAKFLTFVGQLYFEAKAGAIPSVPKMNSNPALATIQNWGEFIAALKIAHSTIKLPSDTQYISDITGPLISDIQTGKRSVSSAFSNYQGVENQTIKSGVNKL